MPTKFRRSQLFADPQAGIGREYPALRLTPEKKSLLGRSLFIGTCRRDVLLEKVQVICPVTSDQASLILFFPGTSCFKVISEGEVFSGSYSCALSRRQYF
jgi:hypothetical protein